MRSAFAMFLKFTHTALIESDNGLVFSNISKRCHIASANLDAVFKPGQMIQPVPSTSVPQVFSSFSTQVPPFSWFSSASHEYPSVLLHSSGSVISEAGVCEVSSSSSSVFPSTHHWSTQLAGVPGAIWQIPPVTVPLTPPTVTSIHFPAPLVFAAHSSSVRACTFIGLVEMGVVSSDFGRPRQT